MATLPKSNSHLPITARKKAVPGFKPVEPPATSLPKNELPKEEPTRSKKTVLVSEVEQDTYGDIIDTTEVFGCCGWANQCAKAGDCIRKLRRINYATTCMQYKRMIKERGKKNGN